MITDESSPLSREDREELAAAATSADRRNTPAAFLVAGGAVLVLGLALLALSWISVNRSRTSWKTQSDKVARIENLALELESLRAAASDTNNIKVHPQVSTMGTDIQRIATQAGVSVGVPKVTPLQSLTSTARVVQYRYTAVTDESIQDLLEWVHRTTQQIPGMRVDKVQIQLTANTGEVANSEWKLDVTFARTEQI